MLCIVSLFFLLARYQISDTSKMVFGDYGWPISSFYKVLYDVRDNTHSIPEFKTPVVLSTRLS